MTQTDFREIPDRIKSKLPNDSYVFAIWGKIKLLLKDNNYFPEYTLHDETHIETVLKIASELIPDNTYDELDDKSFEYLAAAIMLHDLGMFISRDGLNNLIFGEQNNNNNLNTTLFNESWGKLWNDYYTKAKKI